MFKKQKLNETENITSIKDILSTHIPRKTILRTIILILCLIIVLSAAIAAFKRTKTKLPSRGQQTLNAVWSTIGDPLISDDFWNINVMLIGYGGKNHPWWFLTDSIMVASFNPNTKAVTMISIPRDFYVNKDNVYFTRINALFPLKMNSTRDNKDETFEDSFHTSAQFLKDKVEEILWLDIPYFVGVSFEWFTQMIDHLGGIQVNVPETIIDNQFPDTNTKGYTPFKVKEGIQIFDGKTALKYARSRKTTSDFSRSYRQQQILSSIAKQAKKELWLTKLKKIEELYDILKESVITNITVKNALYASTFQDKIEHFFSYVFTYECSNSYKQMEPGCILYTPERAQFNGQAVLIPDGAYAGKLSNYQKTQNFSNIVTHYQGALIEKPSITIENGIDKTYAAKQWNRKSAKSDLLATKLVQNGIPIKNIKNADQPIEESIVYTYGNTYKDTIMALQLFLNFKHIPVSLTNQSGTSIEHDSDIHIVIGNNFIDQLNNKTHTILH